MPIISENERRILYLSLFLIIILALIIHLTTDQLTSLGALFFVVVVALGNMTYLYSRRKK
jgi:accessory gene regulator protein AgrB